MRSYTYALQDALNENGRGEDSLLCTSITLSESKNDHNTPVINHSPLTPNPRHAPFISPSLSSSQICLHLFATASPHTEMMWSLALPLNLEQQICWIIQSRNMKAYPVAKTITSASRTLPSSNCIPFSVKLSICGPLFSLIFPSAISWHSPVSESGRE